MAETLGTLAERVTGGLFQNLLSHEAGAFSGDIEAVHNMRVTSRRLRVVLSNFAVCFEPEQRRQLRGLLARLADILGTVRDLDVMIELLELRRQEFPESQRKAIGALLRRYQTRRSHRRRELQQYFQGSEYLALKAGIGDLFSAGQNAVSLEKEPDGKSLQGEKSFGA
jgi:CHAD domain-containing protein